MRRAVDASVAIKWFVREDLHAAALGLLDDQITLVAPALLVAEVTNACWKKVGRGEMTPTQAGLATRAVADFFATLEPIERLAPRALEIALAINDTVYGGLYLACAEHVDAILVTADARLLARVQDTAFAPLTLPLHALR